MRALLCMSFKQGSHSTTGRRGNRQNCHMETTGAGDAVDSTTTHDGICGGSQDSIDSCSNYSTALDQDEYHFDEPSHASDILAGLNQLRYSNIFCDVTLTVESEEFPCHKVVLSAFSPYFKAMFAGEMAESRQDRVAINGVESNTLRLLLEYAYTARVSVTRSNVQRLLAAANLLGVLPVRDAACRFLEAHMDETNCVGIHCFAETHACHDLQAKAKDYTLRFFQEVVHQDEFLSLPAAKLIELISSEDLCVDQEEEVFEACQKWLNHDREGRQNQFHQILSHIRLCLLSPYFIQDHVATDPTIQNNPDSSHLVETARLYHLLPDRRHQFSGLGNKPRSSSGVVDVLVAVGGEDDKVVLRSVECFDPLRGTWHNLACLPFAVSKHGLVATGNNLLYMVGGEFPNGDASKSTWRYDPVFDAWQEMAPMNVARSELGLAVLDGHIYAVGGWEGLSRLSSVERYDPRTNRWQFVASMKIAMTSPAVAAYNGTLYVTGGAILEDGDGIDTVQCYSPRTNKWTEVSPMLIARSGAAACVLRDRIYVIGGWHASTENTNKMEWYDPKKDEWHAARPMQERRYQPGVAAIGDRIYVCGGEEGWNHYHESVECYDPNTDQWSVVGTMQTSRSWLACAALQVRLPRDSAANRS